MILKSLVKLIFSLRSSFDKYLAYSTYRQIPIRMSFIITTADLSNYITCLRILPLIGMLQKIPHVLCINLPISSRISYLSQTEHVLMSTGCGTYLLQMSNTQLSQSLIGPWSAFVLMRLPVSSTTWEKQNQPFSY